MSDQPTKAAELLLLCGKVRDDALTAENAKRLDALLQGSHQAKELYVQYMSVVSLLESRGSAQVDVDGGSLSSEAVDQDVFAELLAFEQQADAQLVHQLGELRGRSWQALPIGGALQRVVRQPAFIGSIAAVLVLALVLIVVFHGGTAAPPIAVVPDANTDTPTVQHRIATLTAEHDARWAYAKGASLGQALKPGQSLTLTQGFAKITTARGAVAILEAPATVEFTHNDNAIRLHSGKLIGICETESSKGFLVRTPHMDITDLGTRFGVDATGFETQVHVFEGEVQAARPDASVETEPIRLTANQSARSSADTQAIARIEHDTEAFASVRPRKITLPGSGLGLAVGQSDPAWVVVSEDGKPLPTPIALKVSDAAGHIVNLPNDPQQSQWLATLPESTPDEALPTYRIRTTIDMPSDLDPTTARLAIQYSADNQLAGVLVNGTRVDLPAQARQRSFLTLTPITIEQPLIAGTNTIEFEIVNYPPEEGKGGSEYGLRVAWQLHASPMLFAEEPS